jgi:hypothetical protein
MMTLDVIQAVLPVGLSEVERTRLADDRKTATFCVIKLAMAKPRIPPLSYGLVAATKVPRSQPGAGTYAMRVADDGLGVVRLAVMPQEVGSGRAKLGRLQELISTPLVELLDSSQHTCAGHISKTHERNVDRPSDKST